MTPIAEGQIWWSVETKIGYRVFEIGETETYLNCYQGEGNHRDIYMKRLPQHLGGDFADKREAALEVTR